MAYASGARAVLISAALFGTACGGKTHDAKRAVADAGAPVATTVVATDSGQPADDADQHDCGPGTKRVPCERFPLGDPDCATNRVAAVNPAATLDFGCVDIRAVPRGCVIRFTSCTNCIDWCCPYGTGQASEFIDTARHGAVPATADPAGCERTEADDGSCIAQDKPSHAYRCPTTHSGPDYEVRAPSDCIGNPYGNNSCGGGDALGHVCCP